ncbi:DUF1127 domain-containing protein [Planktotalea sp.]|uniref:DUF1127 domain-containing protein n=1 Tax=Planktotalea sp. TaxID=2029877 RepID=UPI003D6A62C6
MVSTRLNSVLDVAFDASRTFVHHTLDELRKARARRKLFRQTYSELAGLSDRDLRDLGLHRASLKRIAMEAANDC